MSRKMKDSGIEWIGKVPEEWKVVKAKYYVDIQSGEIISKEEYNNGDIPIIGSNGIIGYTNKCNNTQPVITTGRVGTVGTAHIVGKSWITDNALIIKTKNINRNFLRYVIPQLDFNAILSGTAQPLVTATKIKNQYISVPKPIEQQLIADFLNKQCSELDDVITKTRDSIDEYKKLKQAVITQAVTKGVRGNRPMKDSGIEWVKKVPEEWGIQRIKTIFELRDEKNYLPLEEVNLISMYTDKGVVQHADLEATTGNKASNADGYKKVYQNDIVVNIILCWMGAIGRSAYNGVTSPAYDIYVPSNDIECKFYHYYFRTKGFSGDCYTRGRGIMAMRWRTYSDQFRDIKVVVPALDEQREIVKYLDEKCAAIDALIAQKERYVAELENYKKSLIYEYVTGKKEVPVC